MSRVSVQMTISLPPQLYQRAMGVAKRELRSKSDLVREALRTYIGKKERIDEIRSRLSANLRKGGVRSLEDIERMIDAGRE